MSATVEVTDYVVCCKKDGRILWADEDGYFIGSQAQHFAEQRCDQLNAEQSGGSAYFVVCSTVRTIEVAEC